MPVPPFPPYIEAHPAPRRFSPALLHVLRCLFFFFSSHTSAENITAVTLRAVSFSRLRRLSLGFDPVDVFDAPGQTVCLELSPPPSLTVDTRFRLKE